MKWNEMSTGRKLLIVFMFLCVLVYLVLSLLDILEIGSIPKAAAPVFFGIFGVCNGVLQTNKTLAVVWYVAAALHFLCSLMYLI